MNILFISPNSPQSSVGGIERYITNLIGYYQDRTSDNIYLILPTTEVSRIEKVGLVTIYFDQCFLIPRQPARFKKEIAKNARIFLTLVENIITDKKIDIICAENIMFGPPAIYSLYINLVASLHQVPLVLRLHSFATSELQEELVNQLMWNKISCVSQSVAGDCFQKGTDIDILSTHYLGVDEKYFNLQTNDQYSLKKELGWENNDQIILTATRIIGGTQNIIRQKGLINLIQAFSKICDRYPKLHLLIAVGVPPDNLKAEYQEAFDMLRGYIKLHGVEKQTIIQTFKLDDMARVYQSADVFVLTSENETFGQVFIEAMSCGVPVIGTKVGGIPEIISDSYNGYLIQPNDASILAQRLEKLINDPKLRDRLIKAGLKTVHNNFAADKQFAHFHQMLTETVAENKV